MASQGDVHQALISLQRAVRDILSYIKLKLFPLLSPCRGRTRGLMAVAAVYRWWSRPSDVFTAKVVLVVL
ncbi:hypothetical protein OS493_037039, partial [Desmophyllum pertusum]